MNPQRKALATCLAMASAMLLVVGTVTGQVAASKAPSAAGTSPEPIDAVNDARRSGFDFMGTSTQAMQKDDSPNPGMLWVKDGEALWNKPAGASAKACASCHGDAKASMRGVAARYPAFDAVLKRPLALSQRIDQCRQKNQQAEPLRPEGDELLALESYVAHQSRGEQRFNQPLGQLGLSCAQCTSLCASMGWPSQILTRSRSRSAALHRPSSMSTKSRHKSSCTTWSLLLSSADTA